MSSDVNYDNLETFLHEKFRLQSFRTGQRDVIISALERHDAIAVMPTGSGKSLCFQFPAAAMKGLTVVISPLIALMKDQVESLKRLGIATGARYSGQTLAEKTQVFAELRGAESFVLYLSPERAQERGFQDWIKTQNVSLFAIDEAHCISQWGPDFRPDYHRLSALRQIRPDVPILALTASATPEVLRDIERQLGLRNPDKHTHGFYRPNLYYQVEVCSDNAAKVAWLRQALLQTPRGRIIVYCGTRKQCEELTTELSGEFPDMGYYHAGMDTEERNRIQKDYSEGRIRILAATNAFGMGIDHPDVRLVLHFQMPARIESLYQEMGRAGRDGKDSTCVLLYSKKDKGLHSFFIRQSDASPELIDRKWKALDVMTQFAEGGECRHSGILTYFKDSYRLTACGHCDICAPDSPRRITPPELVRTKSRKKNAVVFDETLDEAASVRAEMLKEWRKKYADEHDIPAFLVFSNKTLRELAVRAPETLDELEAIHGFGPKKVEHIGAIVLDKIAEYRGV